ncbi:MAG: NAD(P)H-dependent oxidoreductase subunit E [Clostridia bacterium]|nr:NAD(P)H-dependent oxidoreductase subunit E [Clostridia bacterium]
MKRQQHISCIIFSRFYVLGLKDGDTTPDGKFSLTATRCIGCCGLAPVMTVGDEVYGKVTTDQIPGIVAKYRD